MSEARDSHFIADNQRQVERLSKLGWYHSIELPDGTVIPGHQSIEQQSKRLRQFHIPEDLTGKRVLDIGAWDGWFSFEMERRGASVMALDSARNTRLLEAKKLLGSKIDYHVGDICRVTWKDIGQFDIVLFFGVLYHLKHPLAALENVCGMCREMACIESFVTDSTPDGIPAMEFYETGELRGQLDNWCGPNIACLLAFARTAGFARVQFESVLAERAHVSTYRKWDVPEGAGDAPRIRCVENSATHDHTFSAEADDYVTFYFTAGEAELNCDNVYPEVGGYGSRPLYVAKAGGGWQVSFKLPSGLGGGWHAAKLRIAGSRASAAVQIGIDVKGRAWRPAGMAGLRVTRIGDGKTFESNRVRVGEESAISIWVAGLPGTAREEEIRVRLNGTDLPAIWLAPDGDSRQVNALLPAGLEPGAADVSVVYGPLETALHEIELVR
ncbi:MAG TPA: methyltransferase domain-containing protein [Bryobacteraceae bacterium]|nr:methyltransferase domain-containing protein [Bryobacteraceae bacterium]